MILHPWILGLLVGHIAVLVIFTVGLVNAWQIFWGWNYEATTEKQFSLEKKTYLISTVMSFAMFTQIIMLWAFDMAADEVAKVLPGAMCPVGTLSSNMYGWPLLYLKIVSFFLYFIWLVINHLDNQVETYPLTRKKSLGLMLIYPFALAEAILLFLFALNLNPSVITSCCGSVFTEEAGGLGGGLAALPAGPVLVAFFVIVGLLLANHFLPRRQKRELFAGTLESILWILFFVASIAAIISFIDVYVYEMPSHKCPFCLMKPQYHYYGLILYILLFGATATGIASGILTFFRRPEDLKEKALALRAKIKTISVWAMLGFVVIGFLPFVVYYAKTGRLI